MGALEGCRREIGGRKPAEGGESGGCAESGLEKTREEGREEGAWTQRGC